MEGQICIRKGSTSLVAGRSLSLHSYLTYFDKQMNAPQNDQLTKQPELRRTSMALFHNFLALHTITTARRRRRISIYIWLGFVASVAILFAASQSTSSSTCTSDLNSNVRERIPYFSAVPTTEIRTASVSQDFYYAVESRSDDNESSAIETRLHEGVRLKVQFQKPKTIKKDDRPFLSIPKSVWLLAILFSASWLFVWETMNTWFSLDSIKSILGEKARKSKNPDITLRRRRNNTKGCVLSLFATVAVLSNPAVVGGTSESSSSLARTRTGTDPFLVVCTVDGNIVVLDAHDGRFVCGFASGGPLVGPSDFLDSDQQRRIVPGLDGRLYVSNEDELLQPLELTVVEVLQNPVKTCNTKDECGIVTATKSTTLFALNAASGELVWQQSPNGTTTTPATSSHAHTTVLLQREDVLVQQLSTNSGQSVWNVTLGTLQALEFGDAGDFLPGTVLLQDYASALPSLRFGSDGTSVSAVASSQDKLLWTQNFGTVVASVFGLHGKSWKPLTVLEDDHKEGGEETNDHRVGSRRPLLSSEQQRLPSGMLFSDSAGLATYRPPPLYDFIVKNKQKLDRFFENWWPFPEQQHSTNHRFPRKDTLAPLHMHHDLFAANRPRLGLPSPETQAHIASFPSEHLRDGLFLTWPVVVAIIVSIFCVGGITFRILYLHKKKHWLGLIQNVFTGLSSDDRKKNTNNVSYKNKIARTSPNRLLRRSHSLPQVHLQQEHDTSRDFQRLFTNLHANTADGGLEQYYYDSKLKPAKEEDEEFVDDNEPDLQATTRTSRMTTFTSQQGQQQGVGFLIDGIPLIRYSRYDSEFTEDVALGEGGFGTVFRCKNVLDGREYAIKKIWIRYDSRLPQHEFSNRLKRTLREVKSLALLDHPNIVRYYTAWLEIGGGTGEEEGLGLGSNRSLTHCDGTSNYSRRPPFSSSGLITTSAGRRKSKYLVMANHNPFGWNAFDEHDDDSFSHRLPGVPAALDDYGFTFDRSSTNNDVSTASSSKEHTMNERPVPATSGTATTPEEKSGKHSGFFARRDSSSSSSEESTTWSRESRNLQTEVAKGGADEQRETIPAVAAAMDKHTLYIQMQFCSQKTLADFLSNEQARKGPSGGDDLDLPYALSLFLQIAQGVKHVHNQGLIHRDLKPNNCFIDDAGVVKVGDFGLSRESGDSKDVSDPISNSSLADGDNTAGVGTRSYASPEQMKGSDYDSSTDVYSLGIMLFELCYPMYTVSLTFVFVRSLFNLCTFDFGLKLLFRSQGMERNIVLSKLRNHIFPDQWHVSVAPTFPSLHSLLLSMISNKSADRPTADTVVRSIRSILEGFTITSLDKHQHEGSILIRVEAKPREDVLRHTMQLVKQAASPHEVEITQYGLRGGTNKAIMEFAIAAPCSDEDRTSLGNQLVSQMSQYSHVLLIRQVSATKYT